MLVTPRGLRFKRAAGRISEHTKRNSKLKSLKMKHNDNTHDRGKDKTFFQLHFISIYEEEMS